MKKSASLEAGTALRTFLAWEASPDIVTALVNYFLSTIFISLSKHHLSF